MNDAFKGATGKICGHSDMGTSYNERTGKTYSHKLCNKRSLKDFPYSADELARQKAFKTRTMAISATIKSLTADQRKALIQLRNERGLYGYRQLIEGIYDVKTNSVPAAALADLVATGKKGTSTGNSGTSGTSGSGSGSGISGDL